MKVAADIPVEPDENSKKTAKKIQDQYDYQNQKQEIAAGNFNNTRQRLLKQITKLQSALKDKSLSPKKRKSLERRFRKMMAGGNLPLAGGKA